MRLPSIWKIIALGKLVETRTIKVALLFSKRLVRCKWFSFRSMAVQFAADQELNPGFNICVKLTLKILEIGIFWWSIMRNQNCSLFNVLYFKKVTE